MVQSTAPFPTPDGTVVQIRPEGNEETPTCDVPETGHAVSRFVHGSPCFFEKHPL